MPRLFSGAFLAACVASFATLPPANAAPRVFAGAAESTRGHACDNAMENAHEVADSRGSVCSPLSLDATTGCCLEPKTSMDESACASSCSENACCDSFARCVTCCHRRLLDQIAAREHLDDELTPVSHMHPTMWRKWLITHDPNMGGHGREDVRGESHPFPQGRDDYRVAPFQYCSHRCRTNAQVTKYENEYQHPKHHCFGSAYVEAHGADDTLSPGREKLHDQAGDFKLSSGVEVELGLAKRIPTPSDRDAGSSSSTSGGFAGVFMRGLRAHTREDDVARIRGGSAAMLAAEVVAVAAAAATGAAFRARRKRSPNARRARSSNAPTR